MVLIFHPNGKVTGTVSGGAYFEWNEKGEFLKCSDYNVDSQITGTHAKGSFTATSAGGSRIKGTYTEKSITGTSNRSGVMQVSGGLGTANYNASATLNLSR
jgi:hypothetical protein